MQWTRGELKQTGKNALHGHYGSAVWAAFLFVLGTSMCIAFLRQAAVLLDTYEETTALLLLLIMLVCRVLLFNPLEVGCQRFFLKNSTGSAQRGEISYPFRNGYGNIVKTMFLRDLYLFLWSLLFTIPGIVKRYSYRMVPYILAETPAVSSRDAFQRSRDVMNGQKRNAFVLDLSFIGWNLLGLIPLVSLLYVSPYQLSTNAALAGKLLGSTSDTEGKTYDLWLICTGGPLQGSAFPIAGNQPVSIGRLPFCQFVYPPNYPGISREHVRVAWENGTLTITDCASAAGTFLSNGEKLYPWQSREIFPGSGFYLATPENSFQIRN